MTVRQIGKIEQFSLNYEFQSSKFGGGKGGERVFVRSAKIVIFGEEKKPLQRLLDAIMLLTFFDAVVIAIATCSYRDDNMMLSSCVHVVINLTTRCQVEGASFGVDEVQGKVFYERKNRTLCESHGSGRRIEKKLRAVRLPNCI